MFATILAILGVLVLLGAFAAFLIKVWPYLVSAWDWMLSLLDLFRQLVPDWVLPLLVVGFAIAGVSIVVKLI